MYSTCLQILLTFSYYVSFVCRYVAPTDECHYNTLGLLCCHYFSSSSVIWRAFSVAASVAKLAHGEKSRTQSLTQSLSLFDVPRTEACASELISYVNKDFQQWTISLVEHNKRKRVPSLETGNLRCLNTHELLAFSSTSPSLACQYFGSIALSLRTTVNKPHC